MTSFYQRISGGLSKQRASAGLQGMFSDFVHCLFFCGAYTDQNHNIHIKGCMEVFLRWLSLNLVVERWPKGQHYCQAQPSSIQLQLSWLGWDSFNFNFYPPTHPPTPRESTELSSAQLNPTPTQLVGLIWSRISLKPAWAELGTAQSQLVLIILL